MKNNNYREWAVWQKSMDLVVVLYELTKKFPVEEKHGLISQMRRAAVSIPSNIAEGSRRKTKKDTQHFLFIAYGSGAELETQVEIAKRLSGASKFDYSKVESLLNEVMRLLNVMTKK